MPQVNEPAVELQTRARVLADGLAVGRMGTPVGAAPGRHAHHYFNLLLAARDLGSTRAEVAGAGTEAAPREGSLLLWPSDRPGVVRSDGPFRVVSLRLARERIDRAAALLFGERAVVWEPARWAADPFVYESANRLLALADDPRPGVSLLADSIATAVAQHALLRYARPAEPGDATGGLSPDVLAAVIAFVESHLAEPLSVERLAGVAGLSPHHFSRLFRAATGEPPHQYVLARRLAVAAALLAGGADGVAEVALRCGFASQSHLHQHFRTRYGVTPGAYRRERRPGRQ